MNILRPLLLVLALASCSAMKIEQPQVAERIFSPSEINASVEQFDGKHLAVKGYVILNSNGHVIYESKQTFEEFEHRLYSEPNFNRDHSQEYDKYCLTIANPQKLWKQPDRYRNKVLIFRGIYIKDYMRANSIDLGACVSKGAIVID